VLRIVLGHHAPGVFISMPLNLFLRKVSKRMPKTWYRLDRGIDHDSSPPNLLEGGGSSCPEHVEIIGSPGKIGLVLPLCPVLRCSS
jgi:hypothetical protein